MRTITKTEALADYCQRAAQSNFVTVDTEFLRESTYWPRLCLIQIAHDDEAVLVDPQSSGLDLAPFFKLMNDEAVIKVFHAPRQDIEIFVKLSGKVPSPIFDTQIAASVCGYGDSVAYDKLVSSITGERIDKSSRFTDWSRRPLTKKQQAYALADVTHLRDVYLALADELKKNGRIDWLRDEMATITSVDTYIVDPANAWKRVKTRFNKPIELAALQALAAWREKVAQDTDVPRGRVLKDDAIGELAIQRPTSAEAFDRLRAVPRGFGRSPFGQDAITVIQGVLNLDRTELPTVTNHKPGPSPKGAIGDLLRVLLKSVAEREGVAPRMIANSDDIDRIVLNDDADVPALKGWRREIFGQKALDLKAGKLGLAATKNGLVEISLAQQPDGWVAPASLKDA